MKKKPSPSSKKSSRRRRKQEENTTTLLPDISDKIPHRYRHIIALIFLLILPAFLFSEVYFLNKQFVAHDIQQFRATAQSVIDYQEESGEDALWATHIFSGMPSFTVIKNKAFTHIDDLLRRTFSPLYIPVFPFIYGMTGVYFFFWLMGFRPIPSAFAALAICLTTYIPVIIGAGHNSKLIAYSWIPWVFSGYAMLSRKDNTWAGTFLFALALTLTLRAEHIQVLYYFLYPLGIWFLYDSATAWRNEYLTKWSKRAALMVLAGLLALAANIQPYWSVYEYSSYSTRGGSELQHEKSETGGLDIDYAFAWSQGRAELLTLLIPNSFGGSSADGTYWGPKSFTSGPHYFGAILFLMFLIGLFRAPGRLKFVFLGSGILTLLFSLGENLYGFNAFFFHYAPFFNKFRTPEMWLIVTVFSFTIIAAMGMKWICESYKKRVLTLSSLYLPVGLALGTALFFTLFSANLLSFEKEGERQQWARQMAQQHQVEPGDPRIQTAITRILEEDIKPARKDKATSDSRRLLLFILLGGAFLAGAARRVIPANYALAGLLLLGAIDLVQVGNRYIDKSGLFPFGTSSYDAVEAKVRPIDRFIEANKRNDQQWPWRTFPLADNPFNNAVPAAFVYPSIGGYSGAKLSNYQDVIDHAIYGTSAGLNLQVLNMLNTRFLTYPNPIPLPGWEVAWQGDDGVVMENRNALPKAWFVDSLFTARDAQEAIERLNDFEANKTAILMDVEKEPLVLSTENRGVEITKYGPREIRATLHTDAPSFLVLSEIYYPAGWKATLNEETVKIHRANYILRGFEIPEGEHKLLLRFDPKSHLLGGRLSRIFNIIILLIGATALFQYYQKHRKKSKQKH